LIYGGSSLIKFLEYESSKRQTGLLRNDSKRTAHLPYWKNAVHIYIHKTSYDYLSPLSTFNTKRARQ
jgi:hypothetical protein